MAKVLLKGIPASPGQISGRVKILQSPQDDQKMKEGEILVTKTTNPLFTPALIKASAVVTDFGGTLCHTAIVARELAIPAVVGTQKATEILKDDMEIIVNGTKGTLYEGN